MIAKGIIVAFITIQLIKHPPAQGVVLSWEEGTETGPVVGKHGWYLCGIHIEKMINHPFFFFKSIYFFLP